MNLQPICFEGYKIKILREEKGYKQVYFAELLGFSQSYLSKIENNRIEPSIAELIKIAIFFEKPIDFFIG